MLLEKLFFSKLLQVHYVPCLESVQAPILREIWLI